MAVTSTVDEANAGNAPTGSSAFAEDGGPKYRMGKGTTTLLVEVPSSHQFSGT
jgi:hypothetical protein